jgi:predicted transcriptional regulator
MKNMRTTIEISSEQRAKLLHLAARRGMKGFSLIVQEALEEYLRKVEDRTARIGAALAVRGALKESEARELADACLKLRMSWR